MKYLLKKETHNKNEDNTLKEQNEIFLTVQADRGFAAVAFLGGAEGFFLKKRVLSSAGYGFPRRKKSSASLQYCKY